MKFRVTFWISGKARWWDVKEASDADALVSQLSRRGFTHVRRPKTPKFITHYPPHRIERITVREIE